MIDITRRYRKQSMQALKSLKAADECNKNVGECRAGVKSLAIKCEEYTREAESLRALPQLDSFQAQRLARLEKTIANLQGTLGRTR